MPKKIRITESQLQYLKESEERNYAYYYGILAQWIDNGYIIHGTNEKFKYFDENFMSKSSSRKKEGTGFYFSDMPYKPLEYGNIFKAVKKDQLNFIDGYGEIPPDFFSDSKLNERLQQLENALYNCTNAREYNEINDEIDRIKNKIFLDTDTVLLPYVEALMRKGLTKFGQLEYNITPLLVPRLQSFYIEKGYDGYETDGIYTIFNVKKLNELVVDVN